MLRPQLPVCFGFTISAFCPSVCFGVRQAILAASVGFIFNFLISSVVVMSFVRMRRF